jgi:hypothetical protein
MRIVGFHCVPNYSYMTVIEDGAIVDGLPERLQPPTSRERGQQLIEFADDVSRALAEVGATEACILLPESQARSTFASARPRIEIETMICFAAAKSSIPIEYLSRQTVRSALSLPRTGPLDTHIDSCLDGVGAYWSSGRGLAGLAALALGVTRCR